MFYSCNLNPFVPQIWGIWRRNWKVGYQIGNFKCFELIWRIKKENWKVRNQISNFWKMSSLIRDSREVTLNEIKFFCDIQKLFNKLRIIPFLVLLWHWPSLIATPVLMIVEMNALLAPQSSVLRIGAYWDFQSRARYSAEKTHHVLGKSRRFEDIKYDTVSRCCKGLHQGAI